MIYVHMLGRLVGKLIVQILVSQWGTALVLASTIALAGSTAILTSGSSGIMRQTPGVAQLSHAPKIGSCRAETIVLTEDRASAAYVSPLTCP